MSAAFAEVSCPCPQLQILWQLFAHPVTLPPHPISLFQRSEAYRTVGAIGESTSDKAPAPDKKKAQGQSSPGSISGVNSFVEETSGPKPDAAPPVQITSPRVGAVEQASMAAYISASSAPPAEEKTSAAASAADAAAAAPAALTGGAAILARLRKQAPAHDT